MNTRKIVLFFFFSTFMLLLLSCGIKKPTEYEGRGSLQVKVFDGMQQPVAEAKVQWTSSLGEKGPVQYTDSTGLTIFTNMVSSDYTVTASKYLDDAVAYHGSQESTVLLGKQSSVTITIQLNTAGLKINEIYYAGPVNNSFFSYDQFIELYNGGTDTVFLDGTILILCGGADLAGNDNDGDGDFDYFYYDSYIGREYRCLLRAFQLPGVPLIDKKYPIAPGEYALIASDAIDHSIAFQTSIDLSNAEFEFYNPFYLNDPFDPVIPDYLNMITGEHGRETTNDFDMNVVADIVLLASGEDSEYWDGIDIDTIIDGVEYIKNKDGLKRADDRIDKGAAGIGVDKVITKYSGMSIQRIRPGFDTNNSTIDFEILDKPTPGY
jgi:hypothetical protein